MERTTLPGFPDCLRLTNGFAEIIVTTSVGPRIIHYATIGGENILAQIPDEGVDTDFGRWKPWGGHRLWAAPEAMPRTYVPDNRPIEYELLSEHAVRLVAPIEEETGLQKEIVVTLDPEGTGVTVLHMITNHGIWPVELAPWALTIVRGGGTTIIPQEPYRSHDDYLLPARPLVLWHFTDLSDPRWTLGRRYLRLRTDPALTHPQKIGAACTLGWAAYHRGGTLFVKRFDWEEGETYPDFGCNVETYTAGEFMEVESLGPLTRLEPGDSIDHVERWWLFERVVLPEDDSLLEGLIEPLLAKTTI